jgi:RimJ/RimL family protein N-acetyltransferase
MIPTMPRSVPPVVPDGTLADHEQSSLPAGDSLILRPWARRDAGSVLDAFREPNIRRWHARTMDTEDEAVAWIETWEERWRSETDASWAVTGRDDDKVRGYVALRNISLEFGSASITYWTLAPFRRSAVATDATRAVTDWAFSTLALHRLSLNHSTMNPISCQVASKAGFEPEGILRSAMLHDDGWHDVHVHGRIHEQT